MNAPSEKAMKAAKQFMLTHAIPRMSEDTKQAILEKQLARLAQEEQTERVSS